MSVKQPKADEFVWETHLSLRHLPTRALFTIYLSGAPQSVNWGKVGKPLPSGDVYLEADMLAAVQEVVLARYPGATYPPV